MKVLFSITYFSPYVSGLTIYVKRMAEELVKKGHEVNVVCFKHSQSLPKSETVNGVKIFRVKPNLKVSKGFLGIGWIFSSYQLVKNSDAVVINLPQFEGFITALFAKIYRKKIICIYHCEINLPNSMLNKVVQKVLEGANILSLSLCSSIIVYTQDYAVHSNLLKPFLGKVIPIYPPVPMPNIDQKVRNRLNKLIGNRDMTIGVAARLAKEKGLEYLFEAIPAIISNFKYQISNTQFKFQKHKELIIKIVIAGPVDPVGEEKYKKEIMQIVSKHSDNIVFLGTLAQAEIGAFYSLLDVLALPSVNSTEAFGMVQVEAMLCGTPVVASDLPGVRVPVQKTGMGVIIEPKNSQAIADGIWKIFSDKKKNLAQKEYILAEFNLDNTVNQFEKILI